MRRVSWAAGRTLAGERGRRPKQDFVSMRLLFISIPLAIVEVTYITIFLHNVVCEKDCAIPCYFSLACVTAYFSETKNNLMILFLRMFSWTVLILLTKKIVEWLVKKWLKFVIRLKNGFAVLTQLNLRSYLSFPSVSRDAVLLFIALISVIFVYLNEIKTPWL